MNIVTFEQIFSAHTFFCSFDHSFIHSFILAIYSYNMYIYRIKSKHKISKAYRPSEKEREREALIVESS